MYDLIVIGSGAAGLSTAYSFLEKKSNSKILMIESGLISENKKKQALNKESKFINQKLERLGHIFNYNEWEGYLRGLDRLRFRMLGGSFSKWGAETLPFTSKDFKKENLWPVNFNEIKRYYEEICNLMKINYQNYYNKSFYDKNFNFMNWQYTTQINKIRDFFLHNLSLNKNFKLINNCEFMGFVNDKHIKKIKVVRDNKVYYFSSKYFVIACGAIENARILLNSKVLKNLIPAINYRNIGKFYSENPHGYIGYLKNVNQKKILKFLKILKKNHSQILCIRFKSKKNQYSGISFRIEYGFHEDTLLDYIRNFYRGYIMNTYRFVLYDLFLILKFILKKLFFKHKPFYRIWVLCDQDAEFRNEVILSKELDSFNKKKVIVRWHLNHNLKNTLNIAIEKLNLFFIKHKIGILKLNENFNKVEGNLTILHGGAHHSCTTRMCKIGKDSVVDKNCMLSGTKNIFIAGSSVFSRNAAANSTLTIMAFGLRLGKYISSLKF